VKAGAKKIVAIILLASTAVTSGVIIRAGSSKHSQDTLEAKSHSVQFARYELPPNSNVQPVRSGMQINQQFLGNQTEILAQSLAKEIIIKNPKGPELIQNERYISVPKGEDISRILGEQIARFDPKQLVANISEDNLKIIEDRRASILEQYFNAAIFDVNNIVKNTKVNTGNFSEEDVRTIANAYKKIATQLLETPVPADLVPFHKEQLRFFMTQANFLDTALGYNEDPLGSLVVISYADFYAKQAEKDAAALQNELNAFLRDKLSLYNSEEAKSIAEKIFLIQRAYALVPVIDTNAIKQIIKDWTSNIAEWIKDALRWLADRAWIIAVEALKKRLLDMLVDQIVQWIQGGGTPKFITDWRGFLSDAFNAGVGDIVQQLGLGFLCSPFRLQVQLAFSPREKFSESASCTLDKIVSNIESFYQDFRSGGWIAYREAWEQPRNNYFGSVLQAYFTAIEEGAARKEAAEKEGVAGGGFLSTKRCVEPEIDFQTGEQTGCLRYEITTPGKTVGDMLSRAVSSDIDYIVNSRDLGAYVAAIVSAIYNRLIREGENGILGLLTPSAPSGGYILPQPSGSGPCDGFSGAARDNCLRYYNTVQSISTGGKQPMLDVITLILIEKNATLSEKQQSLQIVTQMQTSGIVSQLQQCNPYDPLLASMPDLNQLSSQLTSSIASLNSQITFLNTLYQNIIQTPADRTDLLLSYADQLQKYLEQSGGWPGAMDEHEAATNEKNNLLSLQSQIQSALQACQASQIQQQYNYQP
jgi:hypothetical protein